MKRSLLIQQLATAILAGEANASQIVERCSETLGFRWQWLPSLAKKYARAFNRHPQPRHREVEKFIRSHRGFQQAWSKYRRQIKVVHWLMLGQKMQPVAVAKAWDLPRIDSVGELAEWLGVNVGQLQWFADLRGLNHRNSSPQAGHYHYRVLVKDSGDIRLIESPKMRLKALQKKSSRTFWKKCRLIPQCTAL